GDRFPGVKVRADLSLRRLFQREGRAEKFFALLRSLLPRDDFLAPLDAGREDQIRLWRKRRVIPTSAAADARTDQNGLTELRLVPPNQVSFFVNALNPIQQLHRRPRGDKRAVGAIQNESVPALIDVEQQLPGDTLYGKV